MILPLRIRLGKNCSRLASRDNLFKPCFKVFLTLGPQANALHR